MEILFAPFIAWLLAQIIKTIIVCWQEKRLALSVIVASGGMPSSHTAGVVALACQIGFTQGFDSPLFAICVVFSSVVIYDAINVRRSVGEQAIAFNSLLEDLADAGISDDEKVKVVLGHTPLQVLAGLGIGLAVGLLPLIL